jgi:hypothetical protein
LVLLSLFRSPSARPNCVQPQSAPGNGVGGCDRPPVLVPRRHRLTHNAPSSAQDNDEKVSKVMFVCHIGVDWRREASASGRTESALTYRGGQAVRRAGPSGRICPRPERPRGCLARLAQRASLFIANTSLGSPSQFYAFAFSAHNSCSKYLRVKCRLL